VDELDLIAGDEHAPQYLRIAADLREAITSGAIEAGQTIPAIGQLRATYGCAMGTAQRAVQVLRELGYVATAPGRGTYVLTAHPHGIAREWRAVRAHLQRMRREAGLAQRVMDILHYRKRPQ